MAHTKLPWEVESTKNKRGIERVEIMAVDSPDRMMQNGTPIAHIYANGHNNGKQYISPVYDNAKFIVQACNSFDALLASCKALLDVYDELHSIYDLGDCQATIDARAAIEKAEGN